ncbi:MAG: type I-C CRISPR-associated protein Cas8c/Csd1 [Oscillospiraceae bacterium]|nr:type I-C CRISPR-associated protein Cas8c/Csd1 [Oscillospiraceae bacterium]
MSIWQKAYETYDNHAHLAGVYEKGKEPLSPICHIVANAQIEITLRADGAFYSATLVPDEERRTVIPATEESADRGSIAAHPLSDELQYLAVTDEKRHKLYIELLTAWAESEYSTPKVRAVQKYILGGTILNDLKEYGLIELDENMTFAKRKSTELAYAKFLVRWRVYNCGDPEECWRDSDLFKSWQDYYIDMLTKQREKHLCMISGNEEIISSRHPRATVSLYNGAKLISSKDAERKFAYTGRFLNPNGNAVQAASIGFVSSQKTHCALRWLVANERVTIGRAQRESGDTPSFVICWSPSGKKVYNPVGYDELFPDEGEDNAPIETSDYKQLLYDTIRGYKNLLPDDDDVCIVSLDATTKSTGRLSVTYYTEQKSCDYYERVEEWFDTVCFPKWSGQSSVYTIKSPTLWNIVMCAYGREEKESGAIKGNNDHFIADQIKRLIPCVTESAPVPLDIVRSLQAKVSQPQNYKYKYELVLHTACAVIRKYHNDKLNKEEWTMQLDTAKTDRSYLFGRLLAVMEYIERTTYEKGENREPNAINLYSTFCVRPRSTAKTLEERIIPYMQKHTPGERVYLRNLITDIYATFREEDEAYMNRPLEDTYLLGYYLQRKELYRSKKDKETNNTVSEVNQNGNP